jgi:hypothetical protein
MLNLFDVLIFWIELYMHGFKTFTARPTSKHPPYEPINVPDVQDASAEQRGAQSSKTAAEPHPGSARPQMGLAHPEGSKNQCKLFSCDQSLQFRTNRKEKG